MLKNSSILPIIPNSDKGIVLTYFRADNFYHIVDSQARGGSINTKHLVAFQEKNDNCHYESNVPTIERKKRRTIDVTVNKIIVSNIKINVEPLISIDTKVVIKQNMACLYAAKYFVCCWLHQHNSLDQVVSSYSGWLLTEPDNKYLVKTELTYLPPIPSKVTEFKTILNYMQYLQNLEEVNMPYVNITLDMDAAINAFKVLWNRKEEFKSVAIHLGDFHFMKKNFQASFFY